MRARFNGLVFSMGLTFVCLAGFCADANRPATAVPALAAGTANANAPASTGSAPADAGRDDKSMWVLSPNDVISMTVYQEEDLTTMTTVDGSGSVMLPLFGEVKIGGLTLGQATALIREMYDKDYIINPQVNLVVEQFAARRFAVLGQVQRPGSFDFPQNEPVNLLEAIAMSGGYTRLGSPSRVTVRRVENGASKIYKLDADQLANDQTKKTFQILPNDVITVGERTF